MGKSITFFWIKDTNSEMNEVLWKVYRFLLAHLKIAFMWNAEILSKTVLLSPTTFFWRFGETRVFIVVKCLLRAGRWAENLRSKQHRIDETFYNLVQAKFSFHCDLNIATFFTSTIHITCMLNGQCSISCWWPNFSLQK